MLRTRSPVQSDQLPAAKPNNKQNCVFWARAAANSKNFGRWDNGCVMIQEKKKTQPNFVITCMAHAPEAKTIAQCLNQCSLSLSLSVSLSLSQSLLQNSLSPFLTLFLENHSLSITFLAKNRSLSVSLFLLLARSDAIKTQPRDFTCDGKNLAFNTKKIMRMNCDFKVYVTAANKSTNWKRIARNSFQVRKKIHLTYFKHC